MKNLKVKSILFSLMAVLVLSVFMTSCEQEVIEDTIPSLESDERALVPPITQPPMETTDGFQDMLFSEKSVSVYGNGVEKRQLDNVELTGELNISIEGSVMGVVSVISEDNRIDGTVTLDGTIMRYKTKNTTVELNLLDNSNVLKIIDDKGQTTKVDLFETIDKFIENQRNNVEVLKPELQAVGAYLSILNSDEWRANYNYVLNSGADILLKGFWCQAAAISAAGVVAGVLGASCFALTSGCAVGSVVTLGGLAIPCTVAVGFCAGGTFIGTTATYELIKAWLCEGNSGNEGNNIYNGVDPCVISSNSWNYFSNIGWLYVYEYLPGWAWSYDFNTFVWIYEPLELCGGWIQFYANEPLCGAAGLFLENADNDNRVWNWNGSQWVPINCFPGLVATDEGIGISSSDTSSEKALKALPKEVPVQIQVVPPSSDK